MSVYSEMLRMALDEDDTIDGSVPELVARATTLRASLQRGGDAAARLGDTLAYDVALVRLCDRLGIRHDITGENAGPEARRQAERLLVVQLPNLVEVLASINPDRS